MPDVPSTGRSRTARGLAVALGVAGALFPLLMVGFLALRHLLPEAEPETLAAWVTELDRSEFERKDRAAGELLRRAKDDPEPVIEALVEALRAQAVRARADGMPAVRLRLLAPAGDSLEVPPLPIGGWIFGERTLVGDAERLDLTVVPHEAWAAFTAAHRGRGLAFTAAGGVIARHRIDETDPQHLMLLPDPAVEGAADGLRRVFQHHRFFHNGASEAGRVLALLGPQIRPALSALAAEGEEEAHVAAWTWWRLDRNEAEAATGR